ncbi:metabotropic glutamate receptor 8-like [Rhopilema esculentum]|uniref:metabotropic glutamate receptor 8-like n=1 Tax=Rhopilema esculentum TaxID=499914 RepID=UPI0031CE4A9D
MGLVIFLIYLCFAISISAAIEFVSNNPVNGTRNAASTNGKILLGGLFPIHSKVEGKSARSCGRLNHERGIHRIEAMLYAIDMINKNNTILPKHAIGVNIRDTCGVDTHALEESLHFIRDSHESSSNCGLYNSQNGFVGVIGAASSGVSIQVANLLRLFRMPQISYASTSPDLIDRQKFEYFLRTVPPDTYQARAMVDIISHFNWTSVHALYSEGNYGRNGMEEFLKGTKNLSICVVSLEMVNGKTDFSALVDKLSNFESTRVVVLFLSTNHISMLLKAVKAKMSTAPLSKRKLYKFKWLASDFWGTRLRFIVDNDLSEAAEGAITLTLQTTYVDGFEKYFRNLTLENNKRNPWFKEFWEETHNCTLTKSDAGLKVCSGKEELPTWYRFDDKVPYVIDAVYAMANAVNFLISAFCKGKEDNCQPFVFTGRNLLDSLKNNVSFNGELGQLKFDENGSVVREYEIQEFVLKPVPEYRKLGSWPHRVKDIVPAEKVQSTCSETCKGGQFRIPKYHMSCCYTCKDCGPDEYAESESRCKTCSNWEKPNATKTGCVLLPEEPMNATWVILMTTMSSVGIVLTFLIMFIFLYHNSTAVVKASGRDLTYPLLVGIILCYTLPYVWLSEPTSATCGITRFGLGFGFFICYAALVIKTKRIEHIFRDRDKISIERPLAMGPSSQTLILLVAVLIEALFAIVGLFMEEPKTQIKVDKVRGHRLKLCVLPTYDMVVAFSCNILLIVACTVLAFRTRKVPACFNEAKYIGFVMYTTCVIWIAFITVYFGLEFHYKEIAICMAVFLSATSILAGVFGPKVYIIVFRPGRNIRSRSGLFIHHVYSNQSFIGDFPGRKTTTTTELELTVTNPGHGVSRDNQNATRQ